MGNLAIRDLLWRLSLPHLFDLKGLQKINRRPDSCESLDARAALPQNCSGTKLNAGTCDVNSTDVPEVAHRRAIRNPHPSSRAPEPEGHQYPSSTCSRKPPRFSALWQQCC